MQNLIDSNEIHLFCKKEKYMNNLEKNIFMIGKNISRFRDVVVDD